MLNIELEEFDRYSAYPRAPVSLKMLHDVLFSAQKGVCYAKEQE